MAKDINFNIHLNVDGKDKIVAVTASSEEMQKALVGAKDNAAKLRDKLISLTGSVDVFRNLTGAVDQFCNVLNTVTAEAKNFHQAMSAANTMAGKDAAGFEHLKDEVDELSKTIPVARDQLANGLYQVISNGVPEDNWVSFLEKSAKASVGGLANLEEVVKVTSTVIKNYGLEWSAAQEIQDKIQLTAKNGVTSFEQLAQALPRVTGNASTLGVTIDELMATFSTLTGVSGNTAEVSTQLAAVFTALVKPSSEATEMAEKMGIQFDAASIKAAGGMRQFLTQLDAAVEQYSKSHNVLSEEVYGRLFGSAESLRALGPLTGNLADTFAKNVDNMRDSAGTIEEAFDTMGETGEVKSQLLANKLGAISDAIYEKVGPALPLLNMSSQIGETITSVGVLVLSLKGLGITSAMSGLLGWTRMENIAMKLLTASSLTTRAGFTALRVATIALYGAMSLGLTLAISGVIELLSQLMGNTDKAKDAAEDLTKSTEALKQSEESYKQKASETRVEMDAEIKKLGELIKAKGDTKTAVDELNSRYGTVFGNHKTAAEWYDVLTKKSQAYCEQLGYQAQMSALASEAARLDTDLRLNFSKRKELWERGGAQEVISTELGGKKHYGDSKELKDLRKEGANIISQQKEIAERQKIVNQRLEETRKKIGTVIVPTSPESPEPKGVEDKKETRGGNRKTEAPAPIGTPGWIDEEIRKKEAQLKVTLDPGSRADIEKEIDSLNARKHYIEVSTRLKKDGGADLEKEITDLTDTQINVPPIEVPITALNDEGKLAVRSEKEREASTIQQRYEVGLINKDQALDELAKINSLMEDLGMTPIHLSVETEELDKAREKFDFATDSMKQMGSGLSSLGNALEIPELNVAGVIAQSVATLVQSYAAATLQASTMGPWAWIAFAAVGLAQLAAIVSSVKSMGAFADGGIVGGSSWSGDKLTARVNSGEMILNRQQQRRLWEIVNGRMGVPQETRPNLIQIEQQTKPLLPPGSIVGKLRGRDIVLVAATESQTGAKSGRRTGILG